MSEHSGDECLLYLDFRSDYMTIYIFQDLHNCTPQKRVIFIPCKLYLNTLMSKISTYQIVNSLSSLPQSFSIPIF